MGGDSSRTIWGQVDLPGEEGDSQLVGVTGGQNHNKQHNNDYDDGLGDVVVLCECAGNHCVAGLARAD